MFVVIFLLFFVDRFVDSTELCLLRYSIEDFEIYPEIGFEGFRKCWMEIILVWLNFLSGLIKSNLSSEGS